jgi:hypothetical protein
VLGGGARGACEIEALSAPLPELDRRGERVGCAMRCSGSEAVFVDEVTEAIEPLELVWT